jgi:hypothetical protein
MHEHSPLKMSRHRLSCGAYLDQARHSAEPINNPDTRSGFGPALLAFWLL